MTEEIYGSICEQLIKMLYATSLWNYAISKFLCVSLCFFFKIQTGLEIGNGMRTILVSLSMPSGIYINLDILNN